MVAGLQCTNSSDPVLVADDFIRMERRKLAVSPGMRMQLQLDGVWNWLFVAGTAKDEAICKDVP